MTRRTAVRRALVSVSDKAGVLELARALQSHGAEIVSTGGTARALAEAGVPVRPIEDLTGLAEMMDGRVKTLHPRVHGGLLAVRDDPQHQRAMIEHGIEPIDLVCVNLYPFEATVSRLMRGGHVERVGAGGGPDPEAIEQIDIGGPSMVRSAAKNHRDVAVVTDPEQYAEVIAHLREGGTTHELRVRLSLAAFDRTASYDAAIAAYLRRAVHGASQPAGQMGRRLTLTLERVAQLRYGENPHQSATMFRDVSAEGPAIIGAQQLHGKELSYNNVNDASAALELVLALRRYNQRLAGACVVKHTNPCGCAMHEAVGVAVDRAIACDPLAAYGGILACNRPIDDLTATRLCADDVFLEVIVAPAFDPDAVDRLRARWKQVRLLAVGEGEPALHALDVRVLPGGVMVQDRDLTVPDPSAWEHRAGPLPTPEEVGAAAFLEIVGRALTSNAVTIGGWDGNAVRVFGSGAGQMDRVAACTLAVEKAGALARGAVAFSDAFFPFDDGPRVLIDAGVSMLVHPGGSKRDQDTFELCASRGVTCMVTGVRHFRH